jgi:hypothetical protein
MYKASNVVTLQYNETLKNKIAITMNKLINADNFEKLKDFDFGSNSHVNNKLELIENGKNLISTGFDKKINNASSEKIDNDNLKPINKFTRYFIAINTSVLGFNTDNINFIDDTNFNVNNNITVNLIFKDADKVNDPEVDDIEVIKFNNTFTSSSKLIKIEDLNFENNFNGTSYATSGNDVLIFRRKSDLRREYTKLNIYYEFNIPTNSNYKNLPSGQQLLGTIDYSNTSVTYINTSIITIGNFSLIPSGDGKYLMLTESIPSTDLSVPNYIDINSNIITGDLLRLTS